MLKKLESCYGVTGLEQPVSALIFPYLEQVCDNVWVDSMGNLHGEKCGAGPRCLLCTYLDEPGIIVTEITEDGYLRFEIVGRVSPSFLVSKKVFINGKAGIISLKAIHLTKKKEREIPVKTEQLFVDIGAVSKEEAAKIVEIGDYGIFDIPLVELENGFRKGRAIAGRMGCFSAIEVLKRVNNSNIHVIFATQRELGNRGIQTGIWNTDFESAIVLDGVTAKNYYHSDERLPESGNGVAVLQCTGAGVADNALLDRINQIAKENNIAIQLCCTKEKGAEAFIKEKGKAVRVISLGIPVRYAESIAPVANTKDMDAMIMLITKIMEWEATDVC